MLNQYGKTTGHHCFWLTINGKEVAPFDNESDVDAIIKMDADFEETAIKLNEAEQTILVLTAK